MAVSGLVLLAILKPAIPESKAVLLKLLAIAVFGIVGTQVSYLVAIQYSNAPTATLLQFLFLPMVAVYEALTGTIRWSGRWSVTILFAVVGTLLLIGVFSGTGSFGILINPISLIAGLLAAASAAYYSLASRSIVRAKGSWWLLTWSFVVGAVLTFPFGIQSLFRHGSPSDFISGISIAALVAFVVIFGTILAFGLYLSGLRYLPATEMGVIASLEPIAASVAAFVFLGNILNPIQYLGGSIIILAVIMVASKTADTGPRDKIRPHGNIQE